MEEIRRKYLKQLYKVYAPYFQKISRLEDIVIRKKLTSQLMEWIDTVPVYGFNSASYDVSSIDGAPNDTVLS